ncbi:hypothetical protein LINPERHAP1_LOCUS11310 [Linum perenne]
MSSVTGLPTMNLLLTTTAASPTSVSLFSASSASLDFPSKSFRSPNPNFIYSSSLPRTPFLLKPTWLCGSKRRDQDNDTFEAEDDNMVCKFGSDEESAIRIPSTLVMSEQPKPVSDVDYLQELLAIQQQGPRAIGFFGTRNMGFLHQELIEILSYALVITKNHIYTSGASGTNAAVIRGALRAEKPELLTVILPQSLKKQPPESQELLEKMWVGEVKICLGRACYESVLVTNGMFGLQVKNVIEKPYNDHLSLIEASRLCNMDIISQVQQVICFAFHDSRLLMETCEEAKSMRKIVTLFYLD